MVELIKKNIHMNRWKGNAATQITLDDDFIVPDTMDDMEQVIMDTGEVQIEAVKNLGEKLSIKGKVAFQVLYAKAEGGMQTLGGSISFDEVINVPGLEEKDYAGVSWELEDLNAAMINSRKLSVKAIVTLDVRVETLYDAQAAADVVSNADRAGEEVQVEVQKRKTDVASIALRRKDTYRIKEDITLSGSKPSMDAVLWSELKLRGVNTKPLDGKVHIDGEVMVFVIYTSEGESVPVQWLEESLPFSGELDLPEASEEMIPAISVRMVHKDVEAKPDADGELRELEIDAVLELDMKLYEEEEIELLSDLYSTNRELALQTGQVCFEQILAKNTGKCKVTDKVTVDTEPRILQICHSEGSVKIDAVQVEEDTLRIEGALEVQILYLTTDDKEPVRSYVTMLPFHYTSETPGITQESIYQLDTGLEQLSAVMLSTDVIEVKAVVVLDLLVLQPVCENVIESVNVEPMDVKKLQEMPGIVGYIVQPDDTLWKIAKKFHTTVENILDTNGLTEEKVSLGDKLILIKEIAKG